MKVLLEPVYLMCVIAKDDGDAWADGSSHFLLLHITAAEKQNHTFCLILSFKLFKPSYVHDNIDTFVTVIPQFLTH